MLDSNQQHGNSISIILFNIFDALKIFKCGHSSDVDDINTLLTVIFTFHYICYVLHLSHMATYQIMFMQSAIVPNLKNKTL